MNKMFFVPADTRIEAVQYTGLLIDIEEFLRRVHSHRKDYIVERENEEVVRVWDGNYRVWRRLAIDWWMYAVKGNDYLFTAPDIEFARKFIAVEEIGAHTTNEHGQLVL